MKEFANKKVAILGFGIEGRSAAEFLLTKKAIITVFDEKGREQFDEREISLFQKKGVEFIFGGFSLLHEYHIIVRSPGISLHHPKLKQAKENGAVITSATKIFFQECPAKIIGVTGTKGKGTTSTLIYLMLKEQGYDAYLGGNIGNPPLEFINKLTPQSWVVLELSSFQLMDAEQSPHIAVMLMTTSEHMDYHKDIYEYVEAKRNIVRFQTPEDYAVLNKDYPASNETDIYTDGQVYFVSRERAIDRGCFALGDQVFLKMTGVAAKPFIKTKELKLPGRHNLENICASIVAARLAGVTDKNIRSVLKTFSGLPYRIELVRTVRGVRYYNDSFSTTPETAIAAIEAFDEPKILILGGSTKGSDFTELGEVISRSPSIRAIIGIGVEWERIKARIMNHESRIMIIEGLRTMHDIVHQASAIAEVGDVVLLSPACASFDMFKNYKDRGEQFRKEVEKISTKSQTSNPK